MKPTSEAKNLDVLKNRGKELPPSQMIISQIEQAVNIVKRKYPELKFSLKGWHLSGKLHDWDYVYLDTHIMLENNKINPAELAKEMIVRLQLSGDFD